MIKLSASSIRAFKSCPRRFLYNYIYGLHRIEETESLRIGSNWHKLLEILSWEPGGECPECKDKDLFQCPVCDMNGGVLPDTHLDMVRNYLDYVYNTAPVNKEPEDVEVERNRLLFSLMGYIEYFSEDEKNYETVATEIKFKLPLFDNGKPIPGVVIVGKIDRIFKDKAGGFYCIMEHKSTGSSIDSDSTYWGNLTLDVQTLIYLCAANRLASMGRIPGVPKGTVFKTLYNVWHKPRTAPKNLTQRDSKNFVETGEYYGQKFNVTGPGVDVPSEERDVYVNGTPVEYTSGRKDGTFAIKESPAMYGVRLLTDIQQNPGNHFARKIIPRTQDDIDGFEQELVNIAKTIKYMRDNDLCFGNGDQCEATFKCEYLDYCYARRIILSDEIPEGFKRKYG